MSDLRVVLSDEPLHRVEVESLDVRNVPFLVQGEEANKYLQTVSVNKELIESYITD